MSVQQVVSAHDVARELRLSKPAAGRTQVMKWLYIAQGLHLAWFGEPMFGESIEAWEKGPVVADFWHDLKEHRPPPPPSPLDARMKTTLQSVLDHWGEMSGQDLIRMTHTDGGPWCQVTEAADDFSPRNPLVTHESMRDWFSAHPVTRYRAERATGSSDWTLVPGSDAPGLREAVERTVAGKVTLQPRPI